MSEQINGSIEILTSGGESIGIVGVRWTLDAVPLVIETLYGITDLEEEEPEERPTGRSPEAQWRGVDAQHQPVTILLWREEPWQETVVARAIAHAIAEEG